MLGSEQVKLGTLEIVQVSERYSIAVFDGIQIPQTGDVVRTMAD